MLANTMISLMMMSTMTISLMKRERWWWWWRLLWQRWRWLQFLWWTSSLSDLRSVYHSYKLQHGEDCPNTKFTMLWWLSNSSDLKSMFKNLRNILKSFFSFYFTVHFSVYSISLKFWYRFIMQPHPSDTWQTLKCLNRRKILSIGFKAL